MKILISNDDGYRSPGIQVLADCLAPYGIITVVAPKYHQSAMSMSVSLGFKKLAYKPLPDMGPGDWSYLDATPATCVKFGLEYKYERRNPDVVVCGINHGSNAGTAANYSATLGATEEGALNGCKAIGVSICDYRPDADFSAIRILFPGIFKWLMDNWPENRYGLLYNINFPALPADRIKGIRFSRQGRCHWVREFRPWNDSILEKTKEFAGYAIWGQFDTPLEEGETAFTMAGDFIDDEPETGLADHRLNDEGWITITPNQLDRTDFEELGRLENKEIPFNP